MANVYYSVGQNSTDHSSGGNVSITSGVATFDTAQVATNLGVGDRLTYGGHICYLVAKTSTTVWSVVTALGVAPGDHASTTVDSIGHEYTSMSAAVAGAASGLAIVGSSMVVPSTQKVDIETIKTQAVTCAVATTILPSVGAASAQTATLDTIKAETAGIETHVHTTIPGLLPTALVGGRIDASVGAMEAGVVTATAVATDAIDADALAADAVAEIWAHVGTISSLAVELLLERLYEMVNNKMIITEATGAVALRNIADSADVATGNVQDLGATTVRAVLTWAV